MALDDPRSFLSRAPEILSYLQTHVDTVGGMGLFLLTGSQHFGLMSGITQSPAGRTAFIGLLPFSIHVLDQGGVKPPELDTVLFTGGYPPLYDRNLSPRLWFPAYVTAYVERDVRQLLNVQDLETFQRFLRLCAGRSGQILNLSSLANDCGITHNTVKSWISVLEAGYIIFQIRPHHAIVHRPVFDYCRRRIRSRIVDLDYDRIKEMFYEEDKEFWDEEQKLIKDQHDSIS